LHRHAALQTLSVNASTHGALKLGVNIDHVATLRQARYPNLLDTHNCEPDVLTAAIACQNGGADSITIHLRSDRRHIQDADVFRLKEHIHLPLNFEMGNTPEILAIALRLLPREACLVPESRKEITTEGGLDVASQSSELRDTVKALRGAGIRVSMFIEPEIKQIEASAKLGAEMIELHTGAFANAMGANQTLELERLERAAREAHAFGLQVNAGHGINFSNIALIRNVRPLSDLNIGHSIISRALFIGMEAAVSEMLALMNPSQPPQE